MWCTARVHINDLAYISNDIYSILFADDTNVFISGLDLRSIANKMNNELLNIVEWLRANRLSLNVSKTKYMIFGPPRKLYEKDINIMLSGIKVDEVSNIKFLGVILDNKLQWKDHISYVSKKVSKCIGILYKARKLLSRACLLTLYRSFLYPYLSDSIHTWGGAFKTVIDSLFFLKKEL